MYGDAFAMQRMRLSPPGVGKHHQRMSGADGRLVIQVAAVRAAQIVAIELHRRIGNGLRHHGVVGAVEEIDLLPGQILQRIDIARRRLGVGFGE